MAQRSAFIRIPTPCAESWAAMTPTSAGRHCAKCQTEVIDFTRLTEAEVLAYLAARKGQRGCARMAIKVVPTHFKRSKGPKYWLLATVAFLGLHSVAAQSPQAAPARLPTNLAAQQEAIVISGVVLDDSLNVPVPGLFLYLDDTKYGAITDERGAFTLSFPAAWKPVRSGIFNLQVTPVPYTFKPMRVQLDWRRYSPAHPLTLRLASAPGRGRSNLHGAILKARPVPPPVYPANWRTARP